MAGSSSLQGGPRARLRFEKEAPNQLWQMDFKGWSRLDQRRAAVIPLTVVDDHSRFCLMPRWPVPTSKAADRTGTAWSGVFPTLWPAARRFFVDNGKPWGDSHDGRWTRLGVWLLKLGVRTHPLRDPIIPRAAARTNASIDSMKAEVLAFRR